MKVEVWSLYDIQTGLFNHPMYFRNEKEAKVSMCRNLDAILDTGTPFPIYDNFFMHIGTFDDETGILISSLSGDDPKTIAELSSFTDDENCYPVADLVNPRYLDIAEEVNTDDEE